MSYVVTRRAASLALALSAVSAVALPAATAAATGPRTKAAIEHAERQTVTPTHPNKAQIEHDESTTGRPAGQQVTPSTADSSGGLDATAWQLALSAALGALVTAGVVVGSRRVGHHGEAVAS